MILQRMQRYLICGQYENNISDMKNAKIVDNRKKHIEKHILFLGIVVTQSLPWKALA